MANHTHEINDLLRGRWSPRNFDSTHDIAREDIDMMLEAARWAPSAMNRQPWKFIVGLRDETRERIDKHVRGSSDWALDASALIVNCYQKNPDSALDFALYDLGGAVAHMSVEAEDIGAKLRQFATFDRDGLANEFGLGDEWIPVTICAVGTPGEMASSFGRERKPASELTF